MRVLRLADAHELERQIRGGAAAARAVAAGAGGAEAEPQVLLALPTPEVLRLGMIDNRGMVVLGLAFAGCADGQRPDRRSCSQVVGEWLYGHFNALHLSMLAGGGRGAAVVRARARRPAPAVAGVGAAALPRLRARRAGRTPEHAARPAHARARHPAAASHPVLDAAGGVLHRWFGRRSLRVDSAVVEAGGGEKRSLRELAPIAHAGEA
jgi:putative membrane protein